ncbi:MAG TPA: MBL fold metallo-hydrolase [Caulobacteraceae bacterium]|jgi:glyoxylase-like metal-dependent hydrolase (beta-lactamase superfamily II)|nr:MBL fold metallo-hydrolase [Caulobacteraceae bacterium]
MQLKFVFGAGALAGVCAAGTMALAQGPAPRPIFDPNAPPQTTRFEPMVVREVKPGLYMLVGDGGNAVFRVAQDGVILVDAKLTGDNYYRELMRAIRTVSDKPIKFVFVTHVHNDHSGNTPQFKAAGVPLIASDDYKALVQTYTVRPGQERSPAPTISFAKSYTVMLKGATATAYAVHPAHTASDSIVYFPDLKTVAMGDTMFPGAPTVDWLNGGRLLGMQTNWAELEKMDFDTLIPGHGGAPISRAEFEVTRKKLDVLIERLRLLVKAGTPKGELLAKVKVDDLGQGWSIATQGDEWTRPARLDGLYAELSQ